MRAGYLLITTLLGATTGCMRVDFPTACEEDAASCSAAVDAADTSAADTDLPMEDTADTAVAETAPADDGTDTAETTSVDSAFDADAMTADTAIADSATDARDATPDTAPVCTASAYSCVGDELRQCKTDGSGHVSVTTCPAGTCSASAGRCTFCTPGTLSCSGAQPTKCNTLGSAFVANGTACVAPQTCGGGGTAGVCGCTPNTAACSGKDCGTVNSGCGTMISCGSCTAPRTCGGGGVANKCGGCSGTLPGPTMINAGAFCIDSSEVTQSHYSTFVAAKGSDLSGQPTTCAFNTTYAPDTAGSCYTPSTTPNKPVGCVDWCDAFMYCKWAGKRLCGRIGGGANGYLDHADATKSQWMAACTSPSGSAFPYGNVYVGGFCYTPGDSGGSPVTVKSYPSCTGAAAPFTSIFDMSGNVSEWEDSCGNISGTWYCHTRGGNYTDATSDALKCNDASVWPNDFNAKWLGFRCCAD